MAITAEEVMKHAMIDLETLGTEKDSNIFQVSVQSFDLFEIGRVGVVFNAFVDIASQPERVIHADTLKWWMTQDRDLFNELIFNKEKVALKDALSACRQFCKDNKIQYMWAKAPTFDIDLMRHAGEFYGINFPIQFWKERDVRTIQSLVDVTEEDIDQELNFFKLTADRKHDARDDVLRQIILVQLAYRRLGIKE